MNPENETVSSHAEETANVELGASGHGRTYRQSARASGV